MKGLWSQWLKTGIVRTTTAGLGSLLLAGCDGATVNSSSASENLITGNTEANNLDFFSSPKNLLEGTDFFAFEAPSLMEEGTQFYGLLTLDFALADYTNAANLALSFTLTTEEADTAQSMQVEFMCSREPCGQYEFQLEPNITQTHVAVRVEPYFIGPDLTDITYVRISSSGTAYYHFSLTSGLWRNDLDEQCNSDTFHFTGDIANDEIRLYQEEEVANILTESSSSYSHSSTASNTPAALNQLNGTLTLHHDYLLEQNDDYRAICAYY